MNTFSLNSIKFHQFFNFTTDFSLFFSEKNAREMFWGAQNPPTNSSLLLSVLWSWATFLVCEPKRTGSTWTVQVKYFFSFIYFVVYLRNFFRFFLCRCNIFPNFTILWVFKVLLNIKSVFKFLVLILRDFKRFFFRKLEKKPKFRMKAWRHSITALICWPAVALMGAMRGGHFTDDVSIYFKFILSLFNLTN